MRRLLFLAVTCALSAAAQGIITTVVGADFVFPRHPIPATSVPIVGVGGVAVDANGNLYVGYNNVNLFLTKVDPQGMLSVIAGNGIFGYSGDEGPALDASFFSIEGVVVDQRGNAYFADSIGGVIRKVTTDGVIHRFAGTPHLQGFSGDGGPATSATLALEGNVVGIALDPSGSLYVPDVMNNRVRKITLDGIITTVAGNGTASDSDSGDGGQALNASLNAPVSVAADTQGNLYISDFNCTIHKVNSKGIISTFAGTGVCTSPAPGGPGDGGLATAAPLSRATQLAVDGIGNVFIYERISGGSVRKVTPDGIIHTVASGANASGVYLTADAAGDLFIGNNNQVLKIAPDGVTTAVVAYGNTGPIGDGQAATLAYLFNPTAVAVDSSGNLFIADQGHNRVRKVTPGGVIETFAGNGLPAFAGDNGQASAASLNNPSGVAVDLAGNVFIADTGNGRVRKVTPNGMISTLVSTSGPFSIAADPTGNVFVGSADGPFIKVSPNGAVTTFSNQAIITALAIDNAGTVYAGSFGNVGRLNPGDSSFTILAGGGTGSGDGVAATSIALNEFVFGLAVDAADNLFFSDPAGSRIRKITPDGIIHTVAGNGSAGFSGDGGLAVNAQLSGTLDGLALDPHGNLFITDTGNQRIREILATQPAVQVSPTELKFSASSTGAIPPPQQVIFSGAVPGLAFTVQDDPSAPWLQVSPQNGASPRLIEVTADPTSLQPGNYSGTITITSPTATPVTTKVSVAFTVGPAKPPKLSIDKPSLSFTFPSSAAARSQTLTVSNTGGGSLPFTVTSSTTTGGHWLSVSPASGQALPSSPASLLVTANPAGLPPETYSGELTITAGATTQIVPVTMTISALTQAILLSQTGLSFLGVSHGGVVLPQTFGVVNLGSGVMNWQVSTSTVSGGNWLSVNPTSGFTDASAPTVPTVAVSVNASILPAGTYYGLVRVDAPNAANSPQVLTVFLQVLRAGSNPPAVVQPAELVFTAAQGAESPSSQEILVSNISGLPTSFRTTLGLDVPTVDFGVLPLTAALDPQNPTHVVVQAQSFYSSEVGPLSAGVYNEVVTLQFSDGNVAAVKAKIIVTPPGALISSSASPIDAAGPAAACQPMKLVTGVNIISQSFAVAAGAPVGLAVNVKDDCGNPLETGTVSVSFSNGDPLLALQSQKNGRWEGTWMPGTGNLAQVTLTVRAYDPQYKISGESQVNGAVGTPTQPPVFAKSGIVSMAGLQPFVPLAPGSIISISGQQLAQNTIKASSPPLKTNLGGTSVLMAGKLLPLTYVSPTQVHAIVPFEINFNTTQQILVENGGAISLPVSVDVAPAQPAVFSIMDVPADKSAPYTVTTSKPAKPGDGLLIYCDGLGLTSPSVADGAAAPSNPLAKTKNGAAVTIGKINVPVQSASLVPGMVAIYQISTSLPKNVPTGNAVPLTIAIAGQTGPQVAMAIQ